MMFPKASNIRLKGEKLKKLNESIMKRDNHCCAICGQFVEAGVKAHHEPPRSKGGQDIPENMITLCYKCHGQRHFGEVKKYEAMCKNYLHTLYENKRRNM